MDHADSQQDAPRQGSGDSLPRVRAVSRAIAILRSFSPEAPMLPLGEIAASTGLDAGTTRRILVTLRDEGIVTQDPRSGRYGLTMQVMRLARAVPEGRTLRDMAEDLLNALAYRVGLTVFLSIERDDEALCLARFHGEAPVQVRWWSVGGSLPLNCGAAPRLLLAYMNPARRARILERPLPKLTPQSVTDAVALETEGAVIRARGWSLARDDVAVGLSALAAPVHDADGRVAAAVSMGGLTPAMTDPSGKAPAAEALSALVACCAALSDRLRTEGFNQ